MAGMGQAPERGPARDDFYLPDLCTPAAALGVVLVAELVAIGLTLARLDGWGSFFLDLARSSLLMLWIAMGTAALLCALRPRLARLPVVTASLLSFGAVLLVIGVVSEGAWWLGQYYESAWFPPRQGYFLSRNLVLGGLVTGMLLRYFYVSHQWRRNVERQAESRILALQARIRPHFLFNSMNTIADLTRSNPAAAERAVEDLADLFRASLRDGRELVRMEQELEITRVYERIEKQRLGERLQVRWQVDDLPGDARIPGLTLQPLLENAIYHGIEQLPEPGPVEIEGRRKGEMLYLSVRNPLPAERLRGGSGNRIAVENIRERLVLAFGPKARLSTAIDATHYQVSIGLPYRR
ncbi:MAG: sensor histidine kinase [Gammaproteobacteria bacterium]|nr:MAG: sensor histidine kinase [Gammaproteobacteria bacterium]